MANHSTTRQAHHGPHGQDYAARATPGKSADQREHPLAGDDLGITATSA
jgi:hypothetical protein